MPEPSPRRRAVVRNIAGVVVPFVMQSVFITLLAPHQHDLAPQAAGLGVVALNILAGMLCFSDYSKLPHALQWLYPPAMFVALVIFTFLAGPYLGMSVAI